MLRDYLEEIVEPSLLLGLFSSALGVFAAAHYGSINILFAMLAIVGSVMAQISVNLIDDYRDYAMGIDKETVKTKFSGGSALVAEGRVVHRHLPWICLATVVVGTAIGVYLAFEISFLLLALIIAGSAAILFYADFISSLPFLAEPAAMVGFALICAGSFIAAHASFSGIGNALFAIVPAGMLCGIVLLVNEVPDSPVDRKFGRKHAAIMLRSRKYVAAYYVALMAATYMVLLLGVLSGAMSVAFLAALATLPALPYIYSGISKYRTPHAYEKYMAVNIATTIAYFMLLILAYGIGGT